ncbi:unnamed protein product [Acanthoscelides obtectus]|uniref:Uncharacterized protein n=1 Tax=Acanthoscelides obtectus TaxID=200917 RepID=A0A9P0MC91_ACAOB|nr:unnamed protein product [Acanthoscelides obtectus]CAK1631672.1 hypothetical protein AOBTE_LOCUS7084 [Acanthoscelides obtectus]
MNDHLFSYSVNRTSLCGSGRHAMHMRFYSKGVITKNSGCEDEHIVCVYIFVNLLGHGQRDTKWATARTYFAVSFFELHTEPLEKINKILEDECNEECKKVSEEKMSYRWATVNVTPNVQQQGLILLSASLNCILNRLRKLRKMNASRIEIYLFEMYCLFDGLAVLIAPMRFNSLSAILMVASSLKDHLGSFGRHRWTGFCDRAMLTLSNVLVPGFEFVAVLTPLVQSTWWLSTWFVAVRGVTGALVLVSASTCPLLIPRQTLVV